MALDPQAPDASPPRKGERTRARILDVAEVCFAEKGFSGTSLREIARAAGIREPGLYNHFSGKQGLYTAVLDRALQPLVELLDRALATPPTLGLAELPPAVTDLLAEHPPVAALFQQALQGDPLSDDGVLDRWLDRLFAQGTAAARAGGQGTGERADLAIATIAMFNLCTGYFVSQRAFARMAPGNVTDPENVARQKRLLQRMVGATLGP